MGSFLMKWTLKLVVLKFNILMKILYNKFILRYIKKNPKLLPWLNVSVQLYV